MTVRPFQPPAVTGAQVDRTFSGQNILTQTYMYSFAALGGATTTLTMTAPSGAAQSIPTKCIVVGAWINEFTGVLGGAGTTISLGYTGSAAGFMAATLVTNGIFATPDTVTTTLVTAAAPLKTSAATSVTMTIAINPVTQGLVYIDVLYKQLA